MSAGQPAKLPNGDVLVGDGTRKVKVAFVEVLVYQLSFYVDAKGASGSLAKPYTGRTHSELCGDPAFYDALMQGKFRKTFRLLMSRAVKAEKLRSAFRTGCEARITAKEGRAAITTLVEAVPDVDTNDVLEFTTGEDGIAVQLSIRGKTACTISNGDLWLALQGVYLDAATEFPGIRKGVVKGLPAILACTPAVEEATLAAKSQPAPDTAAGYVIVDSVPKAPEPGGSRDWLPTRQDSGTSFYSADGDDEEKAPVHDAEASTGCGGDSASTVAPVSEGDQSSVQWLTMHDGESPRPTQNELELRVEVVAAKELGTPAYRLGDMTRSVLGSGRDARLTNVFVEVGLGSRRLETTAVPCKGEGCVSFTGQRMLFAYDKEPTLTLAVRDQRSIQAALRGHPLIGEGTLTLGPELSDMRIRSTLVKLTRDGSDMGSVHVNYGLMLTPAGEEILECGF
eukprot:TRINITY_DN31805_c0_g1_i1.p1 TRINITY_DN31805_c0_g1~~TRINITY_DN31805_c0_g1_i1.p1  ORF type:complete len:453 (+),score=70.44 TRINITY_DN31805_c0_g1_i1:143-1501(+)